MHLISAGIGLIGRELVVHLEDDVADGLELDAEGFKAAYQKEYGEGF